MSKMAFSLVCFLRGACFLFTDLLFLSFFLLLFSTTFRQQFFWKGQEILKQLCNGLINLNDTRIQGFRLPIPLLPILKRKVLKIEWKTMSCLLLELVHSHFFLIRCILLNEQSCNRKFLSISYRVFFFRYN